jgi:RNA polymerase sigma-70 factor (ECF subfamily)
VSVDPGFLHKIKNGDLQAYESLYREHYNMLCIIANNYVNDKPTAEEIVGDVFLKIWEKRESLTINVSIKSYLIRSVQNKCINYLEHLRFENRQKENYLKGNNPEEYIPWATDYPLGKLFEKELLVLVQKAIEALPDQCKRIFILSRDHELSYEEIAQKLDISLNTVKTQMKIALARLRGELKEYL